MSTESSVESELKHSRFARMHQRLGQLLSIAPGEARVLIYSFAYFFCLLCSYYIVRPMRDEMAIAGGVEKLQWMFTGTFLAMLAAVSQSPCYGPDCNLGVVEGRAIDRGYRIAHPGRGRPVHVPLRPRRNPLVVSA